MGDDSIVRGSVSEGGSVWVVYNAGAEADLSLFDGLPVDGLPDGAPVELTGRDNDLVVSGGRLYGTIPSATTYLLSGR